jgi:phage terminase small subunit
LNPKRKKFVREYLKDLDPVSAYIRAGYSERGAAQSASRLLMNAEIKAAVAKGTAKEVKRNEMTKDRVVDALWENHEIARLADDTNASTRALELCGKSVAAFTEKVDTTQAVHVNIIRPDRSKDAEG